MGKKSIYTLEERNQRSLEYHRKWEKRPERRKYAREYLKVWRLKNKEHFSEYMKEYRKKNKDHINEMKRLSYPKDKVKRLAAHTKWRLKNLDKVNANGRKWRINNPEKMKELYRIKSSRRRALKLSASLPGYDEEIKMIFKKATQMTEQTGIKYSVDHIWPLKGKRATGLHVPWNLQVIPLSDNIRKKNSEPVGA